MVSNFAWLSTLWLVPLAGSVLIILLPPDCADWPSGRG
ncbi:putative membrane protein [Mycobacterium kansasii]|uniref:Putative membrane protein n=1 Tax=Mycobacterium kansasii TaxID=1768 RepID=A0A1V3XX02_MYCKA|nr:putative membrane protein [Mycobacterium kansasii]